MVKVIICGIAGRMGSTIARLATEDKDIELVGGIESNLHFSTGMDIGEVIGTKKIGILVENDLNKIVNRGNLIVDFTNPIATLEHLKIACRFNKGMIIGTTGFSKDEQEELKKAGRTIPCVISPNMSIGVNILFKLVSELSKICPEDYDIEILEAHHRFKKDAPSGTAKKFAEIIAKEREIEINKIPVHAIRGGDIVGEHTVAFIGLGERIELIHKAHSRETFARGSILAAKFVINAKPGIYEMKDVLGIC